MYYEIGLLFVILFAWLLVSQIVGALFCVLPTGHLLQSRFQRLTFELFTGVTALMVAAAAVYTCGQTVFILAGIPAVLIFWPKRRSIAHGFFSRVKSVFYGYNLVLLGAMSLVGITSGLLVEYSSILNNDIVYYSKVAHWLPLTGLENGYHHFNETEPAFRGTAPYHYFELWFTALSAKVFAALPTVFHLKYVVYGFFKSFFLLGTVALVAQIRGEVSATTALLALFISFIPFGFIDDYLPLVSQYNASLWGRPNYLVFFFVLIPAVLFHLSGRPVAALCTLLVLPIATITALPSVAPGFVLICLIWAVNQSQSRTTALRVMVAGMLVFIGIGVFYAMTSSGVKVLDLNVEDLLKTWLLLWKSITGQFIFTFIVFCLPTLLLVWILKKLGFLRIFGPLLFLFGSMLFFGLVAFQGLVLIDNAYQFVYPAYALFWICLVLVLCLVALRSRLLLMTVVCIGAFFGVGLIINDGHLKQFFKSESLGEYHLVLNGLSHMEAAELEKQVNGLKVGLFDVDSVYLEKITPKHRHFLTLPIPNYLHYVNSEIRLYPIVPAEVIYGSPIDSLTYSKGYGFHQLLRFYRDSMTVEAYGDFVGADFVVRTDGSGSVELLERFREKGE